MIAFISFSLENDIFFGKIDLIFSKLLLDFF